MNGSTEDPIGWNFKQMANKNDIDLDAMGCGEGDRTSIKDLKRSRSRQR